MIYWCPIYQCCECLTREQMREHLECEHALIGDDLRDAMLRSTDEAVACWWLLEGQFNS